MKTLYVYRPVVNADEIAVWYKAQGLVTTIVPADMHVTIAFSRALVSWDMPVQSDTLTLPPGSVIGTERLGDKGAVVALLNAPSLEDRWAQLCSYGCSWDFPSYRPHCTLSYQSGVNIGKVAPFPYAVVLGPERFSEVNPPDEHLEKALVISIPTIVKARNITPFGDRIVEVEASSEDVDSEGDRIVQKGLLEAASGFLARGHIDIDHISELGHRYGIKDASSYIIGRPTKVIDSGGGRTSVVLELNKSPRANEVWAGLTAEPPVQWRASVYGFPTDFVDCSTGLCPSDVKRLLIKAFEWRSLALTQNPVNQALTGYAHVVSAKAWFEPVVKSMSVTTSPVMNAGLYPNDMDRLIALGKCDQCGVHKYPSSPAYKAHFAKCHGIPEGMANIYGHAIMHAIHKAENMAGLLGIGM